MLKLIAIIVSIALNSYVAGSPPLLSNFRTTSIAPNESDEFSFTLTNRYVAAIYDVNLTGEIYCYLVDDKAIEIEKIKDPPIIMETQSTYFTYYYSVIPPRVTIYISFHVKAFENSPRGIYCIRFQLSFVYNGSFYVMKSKGFFSESLWKRATENFTVNLSILGVDGILSETSFSVEEDLSLLVLASLGLLLSAIGILIIREFVRDKTGRLEEGIAYIKGYCRRGLKKFKPYLKRKKLI